MNFRLTAAAIDDLDDIWAYISQDSPHAADRVLAEIWTTFQQIAQTPGIGHIREDLTARDLRFFSVFRYLVVYRADREPMEFVRVVSGHRDVARLLGNSSTL